MFRLDAEKELTDNRLNNFITEHARIVTARYDRLQRAYKTDYDILH